MPKIRSHGRGQGQVLGRAARVAGPGQGQAQAELGVVVGRAGLDDLPEAVRRVAVPVGVELGPASASSTLRDRLRGAGRARAAPRRRAAPAQQIKPRWYRS
jgi:hypothetical protein